MILESCFNVKQTNIDFKNNSVNLFQCVDDDEKKQYNVNINVNVNKYTPYSYR